MVDYSKVEELCKRDNLTLLMKSVKLGEEAGEASAEVLAAVEAPNRSRSAVGTPEALAEEILDTIIVAKSMLVDTGLSVEALEQIANKKLAKWESKIEANS